MNVVSVICEYNPLHNGHLYQLNKAKEETDSEYAICLMSGNITQRGELAIADKFVRAKAACLAGADIVFELPFYYACNSAERFAFGGVSILNALGVVNYLSFGSETGSVQPLTDIAMLLSNETVDYKKSLTKELMKGESFPKAQMIALNKTYGFNEDIIKSPNNILGIEYIKGLTSLKSDIIPHTVKRHMVNHHDHMPVGNYASGSAIRELIYSGGDYDNYIPDSIRGLLTPPYADINSLSAALAVILSNTQGDALKNIYGMNEGLENRFIRTPFKTIKDFAMGVKTKRYTLAHINRLIMYVLTSFTKDIDISPEYVRLLAANNKGKKLLKIMKKTADIKIITKPADFLKNASPAEKQLFRLDMRGTDLYHIAKGDMLKNDDLTKSPVITRV